MHSVLCMRMVHQVTLQSKLVHGVHKTAVMTVNAALPVTMAILLLR